jgi:hypothetical protein
MAEQRDKKTDEERNQQARRINPSRSGIPTGNPQLDPERARKSDDAGIVEEKKRHRPDQ